MGKVSKENEQFLKRLGNRIAKIRKEKGITQLELGYLTEIEKPNITRLEKGGTNPTILTLKKICVALEVDLTEVISKLD